MVLVSQQQHHACYVVFLVLAVHVLVSCLSFRFGIGLLVGVFRAVMTVYPHRHRLGIVIRVGIQRHHETVVQRRLVRHGRGSLDGSNLGADGERCLDHGLVDGVDLLVGDAIELFRLRLGSRQLVVLVGEFYQHDDALSVGTFQCGKGGGQDGDRTLHAFRAVGVGDVVELEEQDAVTSLHLQVAVLVLRKLGGRIDVHPCRHVLVETVVFVDVGGVVSESGYALLAVVLSDALQ